MLRRSELGGNLAPDWSVACIAAVQICDHGFASFCTARRTYFAAVLQRFRRPLVSHVFQLVRGPSDG